MADLITLIVVLIGIVICVILSGTFSASEMAFNTVSANPVRLENEAEEGSKKSKRALKVLEKFEDALGAILIGNNLVNIAASSLGTVAIIKLCEIIGGGADADSLAWVPTVVITIAVIIFGETIPKICAKSNANRYSRNYAWFIRLLMIVLKPIIWVVVKLVHLITAGIKEDTSGEGEESAEELASMIQTAGEEGAINEEQLERATAAIDFNDTSAYEIMTARVDMQAINIDDSLEDILKFVDETPYSRIPVYEGSIDHIIGTLHLNHLLKAMADSDEPDIRSLLMKPCYVYKTTKLPQVLAKLKSARQHLAIVTDEYSGTLGVVSMEDVLEQIVGDIWDETDVVEEEVKVKNDGNMELDGDLTVYDFADLISVSEEDLESESETLGGFLIEKMGNFPAVGDNLEFKGYKLTVTEVDGLRVVKVLCEKLPEEEKAE